MQKMSESKILCIACGITRASEMHSIGGGIVRAGRAGAHRMQGTTDVFRLLSFFAADRPAGRELE